MDHSEAFDIDWSELLDHTCALPEVFSKWGACLHTQELRDGFAELCQRLAVLVAIARYPGADDLVNGAILDTFEGIEQLKNKMLGDMKS